MILLLSTVKLAVFSAANALHHLRTAKFVKEIEAREQVLWQHQLALAQAVNFNC